MRSADRLKTVPHAKSAVQFLGLCTYVYRDVAAARVMIK